MRPPAFAFPLMQTPTMTTTMTPTSSVRILCLHGYRQNAATFRMKSGALRKALRHVAELEYLDAPHAADRGRAWWKSTPDGAEYAGFDESVALVRTHIDETGPYAGVLGFSQGATFASLLAGLAGQPDAGPLAQLRFGVVVCGFPSRARAHTEADWYTGVALPTMHVWGEGDEHVPPDVSRALAGRFREPETLAHPGGHVLPSGAALGELAAFVSKHAPPSENADAGAAGQSRL